MLTLNRQSGFVSCHGKLFCPALSWDVLLPGKEIEMQRDFLKQTYHPVHPLYKGSHVLSLTGEGMYVVLYCTRTLYCYVKSTNFNTWFLFHAL